jgi:hypothetical protein
MGFCCLFAVEHFGLAGSTILDPRSSAESKAHKDSGGFLQLERWLGDYDALFLRRNNADLLVVLAFCLGRAAREGAAMEVNGPAHTFWGAPAVRV